MESETKREKPPLSIGQAAFLMLRVRKVFKKKIQLKKEKNNFAQDVVFPKASDPLAKPARKRRIPPLIRSRTVPAIIVPFAILQAQLVKTAPSTANAPAAAPLTHSVYTKDVYGKSDFSTPGVDYVQFLTGNVGSPPTQSSSGSTSAGAGGSDMTSSSFSQQQRHSIFPGYGHPSLSARESVSGGSGGGDTSSSKNPNLPSSDRSMSMGSSDVLNATDAFSSVQITPSGGSGQNKAFGRFARLLNAPADERRKSSTASLHHYRGAQSQKGGVPPAAMDNQFQWTLGSELGSWASYATPRPQRRRRSLEAEDLSRPRAVSIDSLLKNPFPPSDNSSFKSFSVMKRLSTGSAHQAKIDANNQGFVTAVELGNVSKVKSMLETSDCDINNLSLDGLSLLDVAVIQRNGALTKILLASGATESRQYCKDSLGEHLDTMVEEAESKSEDLMARLLKCSTFGNLSSAQLKELEKDFHQWEKRYKKYRKMRTEYSQIKSPDPPGKVTVDVISTTAVRIRFQEAENPDNSLCTKYKIEWSLDEDFSVGTTTQWVEMFDLRKMESVLSDLKTGHRYYFRVSGGNCKGYGHFQNSTPASVIPSSWRDLDGKKSRYAGKSTIFDNIFDAIQRARPEYASEIRNMDFRYGDAGGGGNGGSGSGGSSAVGTSPGTSNFSGGGGGYDSGASGGENSSNSTGTGGEGRSSPLTTSSNQQSFSHHQNERNNHPQLTQHSSVSYHERHDNHRHSSLHGQHSSHHPLVQSQHQKKNQKIISIKQLFASAPKFQKHFKRGIFLSCVVYSEDKLLVTNEEFLPTIEIDETFPSSLHNDFHWLLKVASTWEDVKSFKADMEKSGSASTFHFRLKLLQASAAMQNALGVSDLGRLYYKTIRDKGNSVVVITTINYMRSTKMISSLNARWIPLTKINSRKSTDDVADVLINSIQEQILYHQVSNIPVGRGLYLGYLKLASSVDVLKIVVAEKTPNMLPHAKIRDNPHVSSEEWTLIQKLAKSKSLDSLNNHELISNVRVNVGDEDGVGEDLNLSDQNPPSSSSGSAEFSEAQELFRTQLNTALKRLFSFLEIDYESSLNHRMYNCEVIEVSNCVSLLVVFPSLENVCLVAGQSDKLLQRSDLIPLPVQVFEMIHFSTYQKDIITRYARLSAILEMDTILAQHNQREAFSSSEMATAKERMTQLQDLQSKTDAAWKGSRWVIDLVTAARDKSTTSASIRALSQFDPINKANSSESVASADAALGIRKSAENNELQLGFHSKSEQSLPVNGSGMKFSRSENQLSNFRIGSVTPSGSGGGAGGQPLGGNTHARSHSHSSTQQNFSSLPPTTIGGSVSIGDGSGSGNPLFSGNSSPPRQQFKLSNENLRKVSMPSTATTSHHINAINFQLQEKMQFKPKIYSTHSQSDSTISFSVSQEEMATTTVTEHQVSSTSLHNLYRMNSSSQFVVPITIPNLVITGTENDKGDDEVKAEESVASDEISNSAATATATATAAAAVTTIVPMETTRSAPIPVPARQTKPKPPPIVTSPFVPPVRAPPSRSRAGGGTPPPVPPRRNIPPQYQPPILSSSDPTSSNSNFGAFDPPAGPVHVHHNIPSVSVTEPHLERQPSASSATPLTVVVIQVFAAYECGLSEGTSVRLQITSQTTARQVVDLLVKQLNAEVKAKGLDHPLYERTQDFCLVAVIGVRERCLRNDFKPLLLQSPWKGGRLYVRKKSEMMSAIQMNSRDPNRDRNRDAQPNPNT